MQSIHLRQPAVAAPADRSYWLQSIDAGAVTDPLRGDAQADVVILGGGYTGLWTALRIRDLAPETRVVVLEADFCGSGASGRNGGQVHTWFAELDLLSAVVGLEEARRLCSDTAEAIDELKHLQESGTIDMDLRLDGWLWTASSKAQEGAWSRAVGMTTEVEPDRFVPLNAADIRRRTGSSASYVGVVEPKAGTVHPGKLATGLRALALARGVVIHERSPVSEIVPGPTCMLCTRAGTISAGKVVLATNAWLSAVPELRRYLYVMSSQVIATAPVPDILDRIGWTDGASICDAQTQVLYYQRTPSGRVVFGRGSGGIAFLDRFGDDFNRSPERGRDNVRELHRVYPELRDAAIAHDWAGPIDCVPEHVPVFGSLSGLPNVFFGMGYNGTGIAQTPIGGRILASLVLGRDDRWSRSGLVGLSRRTTLPSEPFRYAGAKLVRAAIRRKNAAEIRNGTTGPITRAMLRLLPGSSEH